MLGFEYSRSIGRECDRRIDGGGGLAEIKVIISGGGRAALGIDHREVSLGRAEQIFGKQAVLEQAQPGLVAGYGIMNGGTSLGHARSLRVREPTAERRNVDGE